MAFKIKCPEGHELTLKDMNNKFSIEEKLDRNLEELRE